MNVFNKKDLT